MNAYEQMIVALADKVEARLAAVSAQQQDEKARGEWGMRPVGTDTSSIVAQVCYGKAIGVMADVEAEVLSRRASR